VSANKRARAKDEDASARRAAPARVARLIAAAVAAGASATSIGAPATAHAAGPPVAAAPRLIAPAVLPAQLLAAAQAMEATRVSSERFSVQTAIASAGAHVPHAIAHFLALLYDTRLSGEATTSPPAGAFRLTALGQTLTVRVVGGRAYVYEPAIAGRDGGRPWVDVGRAGLGAALGYSRQPASVPGGEAESFTKLAAALRAARAVRELGTGTIDGEAITGYRAVVPSAPLRQEARRAPAPSGMLGGVFGRGALTAPEPPDENVLLEVFVSNAGLPVRAHISLSSEGFSFSALSDVYAIDFPLTIAPPPRRLTVGLAALRRIAPTYPHDNKSR
jgi:hypothetical protein